MVEDIPETAPNGPDRRFWSKQPVILDQSDAAVAAAAKEGVIDSSAGKSPSTRPLRLPPNFTWLNLSLDDDNDAHSSGRKSKEEGVNSGQAAAVNSIDNLYGFLAENYIEDASGDMSFAYPKPLLEFLIKSPPNNPDFNVCLVHETSGLVGFICGKPTKMTVKSETLPMIQINFLCVHKNYRNQRIGPILISEITRRANIKGMFHAAYTVGVYVHKPLCAATYYHRMINRERAMQCGFALPFSQKFKHIEKKMETIKIQKDIKLVAVPKKKRIEAYNLMMQFFRQHFKVYPEITQECFSFMCKSPQGSCEVLCVLDATTNSPCIVLSFFTITTRIKSAMQDLKAAFLYYYAYKDEILFKKALLQLMYILKERNYDLLNCLDIMKNSSFIDDLRFLKGTGKLNYCLYNYNVNDIESKDVALVFL